MGKIIDDHLKRMNPTGISWTDMTEKQRVELKVTWDAVVSVPENLDCSCPRIGCRNNRNCRNCVALHRYYDGFPDCLRPLDDKIQAGLPPDKKYNMHYKIQSDGNQDGTVDKADPDGSRERLIKQNTPEGRIALADKWAEIVRNPKNTACKCPRTDCWYHGNCVKCVALHRHFEGFPDCVRYIVDEIEAAVEAYSKA